MVRRHSTQFLELSQPNLYLQAGNTEDWSLKPTSPRKRNYRWGHSEFSNEITNFSHDYPSLGTTSLSSGTSSNHLVSTFLLNKTESHFRETTNIKEISKQTKEKELKKKGDNEGNKKISNTLKKHYLKDTDSGVPIVPGKSMVSNEKVKSRERVIPYFLHVCVFMHAYVKIMCTILFLFMNIPYLVFNWW